MLTDTVSLEKEFEACLARHGISIPVGRREVMFQAFVDFRALLAEMPSELESTLEPAYIFAPGRHSNEVCRNEK